MKKVVVKILNAALAVSLAMLVAMPAAAADQKKKKEKAPAPVVDNSPREVAGDKYVEYHKGNMPLIVCAYHGGTLRDQALTVRTKENCTDRNLVTGGNINLNVLAKAIDAEVIGLTGRRPHFIILNARRANVDINRAPAAGVAKGDATSKAIYDQFYAFVEEAKQSVEAEFGAGLLLDMIAYLSTDTQVTLSYCLPAKTLALSDEEVSDQQYIAKTSIRSLAEKSNVPLAKLLRGKKTSLGAMMQKSGLEVTPSPASPSPSPKTYYSGGYFPNRVGSAKKGSVDAISVAYCAQIRKDAEETKKAARATAESVTEFLKTYYKFK